jgi:hypothetical protein
LLSDHSLQTRLDRKLSVFSNVAFPIYRESSRWYVDDPGNGFSKAENELVSGIPEMIESLVGTVDRARVEARDIAFEGAVKLTLLSDKSSGGVEYEMGTGDEKIKGWLCPVFWQYFKTAPRELWVRVERTN